MLGKIDVREIVSGHFETFQDYATKRRSYSDLVLFIGGPVVITALVLWKRFEFGSSAVNALLAAFSIFAGLLFNLLVMVLSFLQSGRGNSSERQLMIRRDLLRQITANLSFSILTAVAIVTVAIVALALASSEHGVERIPLWGNAVLLFGSLNFGLTLLMVLKRMYALMMNELERSRIDKAA
jgi:hypothetical protein